MTDHADEIPTDVPEDVVSEGTEEIEQIEDTEEAAPESGRVSRQERLENEGDIAADYLEELLDIADLDGDIDMDVEGDRA